MSMLLSFSSILVRSDRIIDSKGIAGAATVRLYDDQGEREALTDQAHGIVVLAEVNVHGVAVVSEVVLACEEHLQLGIHLL